MLRTDTLRAKSLYELSGSGFESSCSHLTSDFAPASSKGFFDIQATIECGFTLKRVLDMIRTYSQLQNIIYTNGNPITHITLSNLI